jgi:hypothetical protein
MKLETIEDRVLKRIGRKRADVFLRGDFDDLGGYDQVAGCSDIWYARAFACWRPKP